MIYTDATGEFLKSMELISIYKKKTMGFEHPENYGNEAAMIELHKIYYSSFSTDPKERKAPINLKLGHGEMDKDEKIFAVSKMQGRFAQGAIYGRKVRAEYLVPYMLGQFRNPLFQNTVSSSSFQQPAWAKDLQLTKNLVLLGDLNRKITFQRIDNGFCDWLLERAETGDTLALEALAWDTDRYVKKVYDAKLQDFKNMLRELEEILIRDYPDPNDPQNSIVFE